MTDKIHKTALRIPKSLHEKILAAADGSGRTMNAEIVKRLEDSFQTGAKVTFTPIDEWAANEFSSNELQEFAKATEHLKAIIASQKKQQSE